MENIKITQDLLYKDLYKKIKNFSSNKKNILNKIKYSSKLLYRFDKKENLNKYLNLLKKI